jgi:hypothetical protein
MVGDGSAFAVLGLEPDADSSEIERAYRRLIKQHHPDREGGDAARAAEINRAYGELRGELGLKDPLDLDLERHTGAEQGRGRLLFACLLLVAAAGLLIYHPPPWPRLPSSPRQLAHAPADQARALREPMEEPLHTSAILASATDALRLSRTRDEMALASASADCHRLLRSKPAIVELDRCAAFDDAVVFLQDRDPLRDEGPFSQIAVTGRLWSAASRLSGDSVAIDARLDRIRREVDLTLTPSPVGPPEHD